MTERLLVSVREAAQILGLARDRTYELVRSGELRSLSVGRKRLVPRMELEAWIERSLAAEETP